MKLEELMEKEDLTTGSDGELTKRVLNMAPLYDKLTNITDKGAMASIVRPTFTFTSVQLDKLYSYMERNRKSRDV